jgi:TolB protein
MDQTWFGPERVGWAEWSPVNNKILFTFSTDIIDGIAVINPDGSDYRVIVPSHAMHSNWSPDGKQLIYYGFPVKMHGGGGLFLANLDGSHARLLETTETIMALAWSPDGSRIAFVDSGTKEARLKILTVDGSASTLTLPETVGHSFAWSPNGQGIAYKVGADMVVCNLQTMGTTVYPFATFPAWSSKGKLAYSIPAMNFKSDRVPPASGIYMTRHGSGPLHLSGDASNLLWSPDGSKLLFEDYYKGKRAVFVTDVGLRTRRLVIHPPVDGTYYHEPRWSPDGKQILIKGGPEGRFRLFSV